MVGAWEVPLRCEIGDGEIGFRFGDGGGLKVGWRVGVGLVS